MNYAPVIIATLNRFDHLRNCIDSLKKNSVAVFTEIYISIDYPPSKEYYEGYNKIKKWLSEEKIWGFKEVFIFFQNRNLGCEGNYRFLVDKIRKKYDRFILSEDDNVFSQNFLEYINKGLDIYQENKRIMAICGYSANLEWKTEKDSNIFFMQTSFAEWGYGIWMDRWDWLHSIINRKHLTRLEKNKNYTRMLYRKNNELYAMFIKAILTRKKDKSVFVDKKGDIQFIDYTVRMILVEKGLYVVTPQVSKVRNCGFDGSGLYVGKDENDTHNKNPIDSASSFEYNAPNKVSVNPINEDIYNNKKYVYDAKRAYRIENLIDIFGIPITRKVVHYSNRVLILKNKIKNFIRRIEND